MMRSLYSQDQAECFTQNAANMYKMPQERELKRRHTVLARIASSECTHPNAVFQVSSNCVRPNVRPQKEKVWGVRLAFC